MKIFRNVCLMIVAAASVAAYSPAQTSQGRILGEVTDVSGAVVSGAKITIMNTATNVSREATTTSSGDYIVSALDPGTYRVSAEVAGFKKAESSSVQLEVSKDVRVNLRLQPGSITETVEVSAEAPLTDTTDTTLDGVLSNKAINELPLQGRDFQNLLPLHPGVQRTPGGGFHSVTSNGNRPDDNNFFIDGANDNDVYYGETVVNDAGISGTPASILPLDSIQEFNTQESPSADYGVKPGVVVNMGLKSGTNDIHGTAYYFGRNAALDARNYFNPGPEPPSALILHQFGASIGGPIKKGKWFYFFNYEGIRDKVGNPGVTDSPVTTSLADALGGIANEDGSPNSASYSVPDAINYFSDPVNVAYCQENVGGPCAVSPLSLALKGLFLPNTGFTLKSSDPAAINFDFNNLNRGDNFVFKSDYVLNDRNSISARMIYSNTTQTEEDGIPLRPEWLSQTSPKTQVFGTSWIWTPNTSWINEARFSYNRFNETIAPADSNVNPITYGLTTGITDPRLFGFPRITPGSNFDYMGGVTGWPLATTPSATYNYSDTVSFTRGKHALRFGGQFSDGRVNYYRASYGRGRVDFSDLTDFIAGNVRRWRLLYGDPARDISMKAFGFFAQDTYRISPRVTLNLGLRYDVTGAIKDSQNRLANFSFTQGFQQVGKDVSQPYPTNYNNISPRLGIAWDVFGNAKTVVRAGGGIIFEQPSVRTFMFSGGGLNLNPSGLPQAVDDTDENFVPGTGTITSFLQVHSGPEGIDWSQDGGTLFPVSTNSGACMIDGQCDVFAVDPHLKTPYVSNWNLNVQQQIGKDAVLQIAYVANHGTKLYSVTDPNQVDYALDYGTEEYGRPLASHCPAPTGIGTGGLCMPGIGFAEYLSNYANSSYNSMQVTFTKRYSHGLYLLAGYTWAHGIDTATSNLAFVPQDSLNYAAERGDGDYDIRNRFTLSLSYDLPSKKTKSQMLEGWQINTLAMFESAMPYSLYDSNDISGTGEEADRWNIAGNPRDLKWSVDSPPHYVDFYDGETDPACVAQATTQGMMDNLNYWGCYHQGSAVLTPPADGTFGTMGRNIFRGPGFYNWDFSVTKTFKIKDRLNFQFRAEFFNLLNHSNFPTPTANTDLADPTSLATVSYTPDVRASNPVIGSGGSRHIQLGAKFSW